MGVDTIIRTYLFGELLLTPLITFISAISIAHGTTKHRGHSTVMYVVAATLVTAVIVSMYSPIYTQACSDECQPIERVSGTILPTTIVLLVTMKIGAVSLVMGVITLINAHTHHSALSRIILTLGAHCAIIICCHSVNTWLSIPDQSLIDLVRVSVAVTSTILTPVIGVIVTIVATLIVLTLATRKHRHVHLPPQPHLSRTHIH